MEKIRLTTAVGEDGTLHVDVRTSAPPGPAEVTVVINPLRESEEQELLDWSDEYGVDKDLWRGIDACERRPRTA